MGSNKTWQLDGIDSDIFVSSWQYHLFRHVLLANAYGNSLGQIKTKWQVGICLQPRGVHVFVKVEEGF